MMAARPYRAPETERFMSINPRRHSDGRTVYDVRLRDPNGRSYKRTFRTKKEAEHFSAKERVERGQGT
jgi:hypothetical protein